MLMYAPEAPALHRNSGGRLEVSRRGLASVVLASGVAACMLLVLIKLEPLIVFLLLLCGLFAAGTNQPGKG